MKKGLTFIITLLSFTIATLASGQCPLPEINAKVKNNPDQSLINFSVKNCTATVYWYKGNPKEGKAELINFGKSLTLKPENSQNLYALCKSQECESEAVKYDTGNSLNFINPGCHNADFYYRFSQFSTSDTTNYYPKLLNNSSYSNTWTINNFGNIGSFGELNPSKLKEGIYQITNTVPSILECPEVSDVSQIEIIRDTDLKIRKSHQSDLETTNKDFENNSNNSNSATQPNILDVSTPSPNAAAFTVYGNTPLNHSKGQANFNVPMASLVESDLNYNLGISYLYTGFKPAQQNGNLGIGFILNASGMVTRSKRGLYQDEKFYGTSSNGIGGYLVSGSKVAQRVNSQTGEWIENCTGCPNAGEFSTVYDGEPDEFFFNYGNISGSFFFGSDGQIKIRSEQNLKIEHTILNSQVPISGGSQQNITQWVITDENGVKYKFGYSNPTSNAQNNVDFTLVDSQIGESYISTWHLFQIESITGNTINFTYANDQFNSLNQNIALRASNSMTQNAIKGTYQSSFSASSPYLATIFNTENILTKIESSNWEVDFTYSTYESTSFPVGSSPNNYHKFKILDKLNIKSKDSGSQFVNEYTFDYLNLNQRFYLNTLTQKDKNGSIVKPYTFTYDNVFATLNVSPFHFGIDYWNYYNGASNSTLIPMHGANRSSSFNNTKIGALTNVTYPTGGSTSFVYEQNDYSYIRENFYTDATNSSVHKASLGGLRIQSITDNPGNREPTIVKNYTYTDPTNSSLSSGIVDEIATPYAFSFEVLVSCSNFSLPPGLRFIPATNFFIQPICPVNNTIDYQIFKSEPFNSIALNPVYYFHVTETIENISKINYLFTSHLDQNIDLKDFFGIPYGLAQQYSQPIASKSFARSLPKKTQYYDYLNNAYHLVKETENTYAISDIYKAPMFYSAYVLSYNNVTDFVGQKSLYDYSGWVRKISKKDTYYYGSTGVSTINNYTYASSNSGYYYPTSKSYTNSKGKLIQTSYNRPLEMVALGQNPGSVYSNMFNKHIIEPVAEEIIKENGAQLKKTATKWKNWSGNFFAPESVSIQYGNSDPAVTQFTVNSFNARGKPTSATDKANVNTTYSYFSSAGTFDYLKEKTSSNLTNKFEYTPQVGLNKITQPNNLKTTFQYDDANRLLTSKDHNNSITDLYKYNYASYIPPAGCGLVSPPTLAKGLTSISFSIIYASGCTNSVLWSNNSTGNNYIANTGNTENYSAKCINSDGCSSAFSSAIKVPDLTNNRAAKTFESTNNINGGVLESGGNIQLKASGPSNSISTGTSINDEFQSVFTAASGNQTLIVRIGNINSIDGYRSGIMFRETNDPKSKFFELILDGNGHVGTLYRQTTNGNAEFHRYNSVSNFNGTDVWLKLTVNFSNSNANFTAQFKPNASASWNDLAGNSHLAFPIISFNSNYLMGITCRSNVLGSNHTIFTNLSP